MKIWIEVWRLYLQTVEQFTKIVFTFYSHLVQSLPLVAFLKHLLKKAATTAICHKQHNAIEFLVHEDEAVGKIHMWLQTG